MAKKIALLAALALLDSNYVSAVGIQQQESIKHKLNQQSEGIFGRMIDQVTAGERLAEERHVASDRKAQQLEDAEKDYQRSVDENEREEAASKKKDEDAAEQAAFEAAKNTPQARMMTAANDAASSINMSEIEANIQANLQAKLDSGASKAELLAGAGADDLSVPANSLLSTGSQNTAQAVVAQVLASHRPAPAINRPAVVPQQQATQAAAQANQEKVMEMAQKLGIPFTQDLVNLGSNAAISDALIEKAVAAGKTEGQINAAMATI